MGLTKVTGFKGEAELLGSLRQVEFSEDGPEGYLTIRGLGLDGAYAILAALASKELAVLHVQAGDRPAGAEKRNGAGPKRGAVDEAEAVSDPEKVRELRSQEGAKDAGDVPPEIAKSGRFVEVMQWVMRTRGLTADQPGEIAAELEKLRDRIAVVKRVVSIPNRVEANLDALREAGGDAA